MLQKLNERIQGVVAWIIIILIALTFMLFGVDYYMQSHQPSDIEVSVNGQPISKQMFEINYRRIHQQHNTTKFNVANDNTLKKQILDDMIMTAVTVQSAKNNGFEVSSEQANAAIISIPQFQQDGHFSKERYQQALSGAMFTSESFQREVKQGMLINQQRFTFVGSAFAIPAEVKHFVKLYMQTRDYDYLQIPTTLFTDKQQISEEQIENYYKNHKDQFTTPEKVSIDFIRLSMQKIRKSLTVSTEDSQRYYEDNQNNFSRPPQWKVAHILFAVPQGASIEVEKQIKQNAENIYQKLQNNPAQFSQWVKTLSSDKLSTQTDGVLPWIVAGQTEFDKPLSTLTHPGAISTPFKTTHGYEIFKLIAYKPVTLKPLQEVKSQIAEEIMAERAQARYTQILEQLTDLSYQTPDTLSIVAEQLKLPIEHTMPFSRDGGGDDITQNKQVINTAFNHDVMTLGNNSEPVPISTDGVIVLRVNKRIPPIKKALPDVRDVIINQLIQEQAKTKAKELGTALLSTKTSNSDETSLSTALIDSKQLVWHEVIQAKRDDSDTAIDATINALAFSLSKPNSRDGRQLKNGDFIIVRLKKITDGQYNKLDKEQQANLTQQIETSYGLMDYDIYINKLVSTAKIDK